MTASLAVVKEAALFLITLSIGLYSVCRGWKLCRFPTEAIPPATYRLAIWCSDVFGNETVARSKEVELMNPKRLRRSGIYALVVGCGMDSADRCLIILLGLKSLVSISSTGALTAG